MAEHEAARQTPEPVVISDTPDVCLTPVGGAMVPVPYDIVAFFSDAQNTTATVVFTADPAFTTASFIPSVIGDEAGTGKGVVSGAHASSGSCHVVANAHTPVVRAEGNLIVYDSSKMEMNCASPSAPGNTVGTVVWQFTETYTSADANGELDGETDPEAEPESEEELRQALSDGNASPAPERAPEGERLKLKDSATASEGYNRQMDSQNPSHRSWGTPSPDGPPDGISSSADLSAQVEKSFFDESLYEVPGGSADNYLKVGNAEVKGWAGYRLDKDGVHHFGAGGNAGAYVVRGQAKGSLGDGLLGGSAQGEALSVKGNAELGAFRSDSGGGVRGALGAEANLVQGELAGETVITVKNVYDNTVGALLGRFESTRQYAEAPESLDVGVVVGAGVEAGIGAGAAAEGQAGIENGQATASGRVAIGLGPKVAVKLKAGIKLPEGTVDRAAGLIRSLFGGG